MNTNYDLKRVKEQVQEVMEYVTYSDEINTTDLYETWYKNKSRLINILGGLVWQSEEPIEVIKSDQELETSYEDFLEEIGFCFTMLDKSENNFHKFLEAQGRQAFYDNKVVAEWHYKGKKIPKGMKLNKSFKFFMDEKTILNKWQSKHSMIIQRRAFKGYLRLSVHPLDFLSVGTSAHGWSSCHDLKDGHCAGPLSYMGDSTSLVAYICTPTKAYQLSTFPPNIEWNSKKWRTMLYLNEDNNLIVAGKGYPFEADDVTEVALESLQGLLPKEFSLVFKPNSRQEIKQYIADHDKNAVHYNDCLLASSFYGYVSKAVAEPKQIVTGSTPVCLYCGENMVIQPNGFACMECGCYTTCDICGSPIGVYEEDIFHLDNMCICEDCYDDHAAWCNECGDIFDKDGDEVVFDEVDEEYYCKHCYEIVIGDRCAERDDDDWFDM